MFILKLLVKVILLPIWLFLFILHGLVDFIVNVYSAIKAIIGIVFGIALIGTIIWYRQDYMRYVILGVSEGILLATLAAGVFVQALLEIVMISVSSIIFES